MSRLRRSVIIQLFSSNGATVAHFVVSLILARILSPDDIGIFSITVVVANVAHIFRDFGVNSYLRAVKECTPETIRAANGILVVSSSSMGIFLFSISGLVADYYGQPGIQNVMRVLAVGFFFIPLGATTLALLARELNATANAWINLWSVLSYSISAVTLAYLGFGYMSMAWANLVTIIATGLAAARYRPTYAPWLPSLRGWRKVVNFGTGSILGNSIGAINSALPDVMLGKMSGPYDVGLLSRANSTASLFTQIASPTVNYAALPHLAPIHHRGESLEPTLCKASAYLSCLGWPALLVTAIFSRDVILLLYGPTWLACEPAIQLLCLMGGINLLVSFDVAALSAIGRPYLASLPEISLFFLRAGCVLLCYDQSLASFAWGLVIAEALNYPIHRQLQSRKLGVRGKSLLIALRPSILSAAVCGLVTWLMAQLLPGDLFPVLRLLAVSVVIVPVWVLSLKLFAHPFSQEIDTLLLAVRRRWGW